MVVEGASQAIKGAAYFVAKRAPESAGKAAGTVVNTAEKAVGVAKGVVESTSGKLKGASENFRKSFVEARNSQMTQQLVDKIAANDQSVVSSSESPVTPDGATTMTKEGDSASLKPEIAVESIENPNNTEERHRANVERHVQKAIKESDEEFKNSEKDTNGLPKDPTERRKYLAKYNERSGQEHDQALKDTLLQEYEAENPTPNKDEDPIAFDQWARGQQEYMNAADEAKQEAEKVAKAAESGADADKQTAEKVVGEEDAGDTKEDTSTSMSNAFRLANALENAQDDYARKQIESKIQGIHDGNLKARPQFKTRVKIAQTIQIGKAVLLMSGMGLATNAVSSVATASAK